MNGTVPLPIERPHLSRLGWYGGTVLALLVWALVYPQLPALAEALVAVLPVERTSPAGEALWFFLYDAPKVLMLLTLVVFAMGVVRSFVSAERVRALLAGRREGVGNLLAAGLGTATPFCSCSAIPLFVGFVSAGVPLGVTFSFLIAAPMVNEVAVGLLLGLVGWRIALAYLGFGLLIAVLAGIVIGRLRLEGWLEDWVRELRTRPICSTETALDGPGRIRAGLEAVREIVGRVWYWIVAGIAVGAVIHGWVPAELLARIMGAEAWWSVPAAVLIGVPMYANAAGIIPVVEALLAKGAALGTVLAFMMSVIALSLPEMLILRRVLKLPLIVTFAAVVASGILLVGFLFNLIAG
jgi:uncharacterized membrane protein YraQ (UPF0718 family)